MLDLRSAKVLALAALATVLVLSTSFSTAVFTDSSASTARVSAAADWTAPTVELRSTASYLRGTVPLAPSASDGESALTSVTVEHRLSGAGSWTTVCSDSRSSYTCTWDTTRLADGRYDVRAGATDAAGYTGYTPSAAVTVDNTAPTVALTDPGSPLTGTKVFATTGVSDATSGVARVEVQHLLAGTSTWRMLCVADASPWSCSADTTTLANGSYGFRAVATDLAGNAAATAVVRDRVVDNSGPSVTLEDPGPVLSGSLTLRATASSVAGVTSVQFQYAPSGTSAWVNIGTPDTSAPYARPWDTTSLPDGTYDLRAVMVDSVQRTVDASRHGHQVSNVQVLQGLDVQTTNRTRAGYIEQGDTIIFTLAGKVDRETLLPGWANGAKDVTLRIREGASIGRTADQDTLDVLVGDTVVGLGSVNLRENFVKRDFAEKATMTAVTTTVNGQTVTVVIIEVGELHSRTNGTLEQVSRPAAMSWSPSSNAPSVLVDELGALDVDF